MASLNVRTGKLGRRLAAHLLRRATFRYDKARIDQFANMTANQAVNELFKVSDLTMPGPIAWTTGNQIIQDDGTLGDNDLPGNQRRGAIFSWFIQESMVDVSIRHRMAWFLHTCYPTQYVNQYDSFYHFRLLQKYAFGNLKQLSRKITLDLQMLIFLDNRNNIKGSPNENFAREFLELYTILKGKQISADNYTNYTEADISEAARLLTGFTVGGNEIDPDTGLRKGRALLNRHDTGDKTFSAAFGNKTIQGRNSEAGMYEELAEFVDMVFDQKETARAFVRRLYRFMVRDNINAEVEQGIIGPLADQLYDQNYVLEFVVKKLLKSEHFYDEDDSNNTDETIGGKLRSPLDLILQSINFFGLDSKIPDPKKYDIEGQDHYQRFYSGWLRATMKDAGMEAMYPPSVLGYDAYAQAPDYSKLWFDGSTIIPRMRLGEQLVTGKRRGNQNISETRNFRIDVVAYVESNISNPASAEDLVKEVASYMLPESLPQKRLDYFMGFLRDELQAIEWEQAWSDYQNTGDVVYVQLALEEFFDALMRSPEYQTF